LPHLSVWNPELSAELRSIFNAPLNIFLIEALNLFSQQLSRGRKAGKEEQHVLRFLLSYEELSISST
jgi:hypothetical protein